MLGDNSGAAKIYIIIGYTDMRKSIDGLCATIMSQLQQEPGGNFIYLFAVNAATVSRSYYANRMDMSFYYKAYQKENLCTFQKK